MRDVEQAIKLSTQGCGAVDERKAALPRWSAPVLSYVHVYPYASPGARFSFTFDHSDLAISSNNAPVRAYDYTLNGLEQLGAMESDNDEEICYARREAAREVEKALEDEEVKCHDVESEEFDPAAGTQDILLADDVAPITKDAKPVLPDAIPATSSAQCGRHSSRL
ncbi:hypothetical protein BC826DRAFT_1190168 [Russula brevipes]|nr:hypothetical protein BC826DRAFT_1190168 [Russula brevipes]